MRRLNLGCGNDHKPKEEGWLNIDINQDVNPDIVADLNLPIEIEDNEVDEVLMRHCLEHLNQGRFFSLMKELWIACVNNAIITIIVPHWQSEGAFEPDHKWIYPPRSLKMITESSYQHLIKPAQFEIVELIEKDNSTEPQTIMRYRVIK